MAKKDPPEDKGCGCGEKAPEKRAAPVEKPLGAGKRFVRPLGTPTASPRARRHQAPEPLSEVCIVRPGSLPVHVVVPTKEVGPELIRKLEENLRDLPRIEIKAGEGGVDIKLEDMDGAHVKTGAVVLEGKMQTIPLALDPTTRRFRVGGLVPGEYQVRVASSAAGRALMKLTVRKNDVTRAAIRLDGSRLEGTTSVRFAVKNTKADSIHVKGTDKNTGRVVFRGDVKLADGVAEILDINYGIIHWDFDDGTARSCYDSDTNDLTTIFLPTLVELNPIGEILPDPPDWRFSGLPRAFVGVAKILPDLGIRSLEELAAAEPEGLMHEALRQQDRGLTPTHPRLFAEAIDAARIAIGARKVSGEQRSQIRLAALGTFSRAFSPRAAGEMEIEVDLGPGKKGELTIQGPSGEEKRTITGKELVKLTAKAEDVAGGKAYRMSVTNLSEQPIEAIVHSRLPADRFIGDFIIARPSLTDLIEEILEGLAVSNPGLGTTVPGAITAPENIDMWLDRARTFMLAAGVCSITDLGKFRVNPMPVLRPGAYVAPLKPPLPGIGLALSNFVFDAVLGGKILHYLPNDILHETAVVLAGEWDIRGQSIIIGKEVRELVVIARSINHDASSRISWETPVLPGANAYWPNPAPSGDRGVGFGGRGEDGDDGDQTPHPSKNGGANAVTPGPTVTMYVLDTTNNLPPIDLNGQKGGTGGRGQDGGRGGDGECGRNADGTVFGGCCRGVGHGGDGGQGGDGGRGGKGGQGGEGGRITLLTNAQSLAVLASATPPIVVNGGSGGDGGPAGNPAGGGFGGPPGSADCEPWCDEHPERRGNDGGGGAAGLAGFAGDTGPAAVEDAIQFLPITEEQWLQELTNPHIFDLNPDEVEPGQTVQIIGHNFDPAIDRVYYDGVNVGPVTDATHATFTVPLSGEGGNHPVVIRPSGATARRSNRAMLHVIPKLDAITSGPRWLENQNVTLTGLAFVSGLQVLAEDRSVTPVASFSLPVVRSTRTSINVQVPGGFLGGLRGVRRIVVRNPDGGTTRDERVVRISDTIVVECAAFRVVGTRPGIGTTRSAADIGNLFIEGAVNSLSIPWAQARIVFRLVQPVATIAVADDQANAWPIDDPAAEQNIFTNAPGVPGALNFFFFRDVEVATAYAYFGGGPLFIGDEGGPLGAVDFQQVVAHEIGHALCLRHICDGAGEGPGTFFNRECDDGDEAFLMYPFWDTSNGMAIHAGQVDPARIGATHFEDGKTASLPAASLFQGNNTNPQCGAQDAAN